MAAIVAVLAVGAFLVLGNDDDGDEDSGPDPSSEVSSGSPDDTTGSGDIPAATEEPDGLGNDGELDDLAEDCFDGQMDACDDLYRDSDFGSDYERYGDTCAGRQEAGTSVLCTVAFPGD